MISFAAIALNSSGMLVGLSLLALPVIAHLIRRHARRQLVFPSIVMLRQSAAEPSGFFRPRRWILLLLRCLAVMMVVLAFAQPSWREPVAHAGDSAGGTLVVVVLDVSASTAAQIGGVGGATVLQRLSSSVERALGSSGGPDDRIHLVLAAHRPRQVFSQATANVTAVQAELASLRPSAERADFSAALAHAGMLLEQHAGGGPRQLVFASDLQAENLSGLPPKLNLPPRTRVTILTPDAAPKDNMALSEPTVYPASVQVDRPAQMTVIVSNFSTASRSIRVNLLLNDTPAGEQSLTLDPHQRREVAFNVRFDRPGLHLAVFAIDDDALAIDNRAYLVVDVVQRTPITLITDENAASPTTAAYFVSRALTPFGDQRDRFEVHRLRGDEVTTAALRDSAVVVLGETASLPVEAAGALARYVQQGGGVILFGGQSAASQVSSLRAIDPRLPPWSLGGREYFEVEPLFIAAGQWRSRMLREFDDPAQAALEQARFTRVWSISDVQPSAEVLLHFNDATAALIAMNVGYGRMVAANFNPSPSDSNLAKYGIFVAMMHSLVRDAQPPRTARRGVLVGEPLLIEASPFVETSGPLQVRGPNDQLMRDLGYTRRVDVATAHVARAAQPGFYALEQAGAALALGYANVDPRESDLRRIDAAALERFFASSGATARTQAGAETALPRIERPLWGWMFAFALAAVGIELILLALWKR